MKKKLFIFLMTLFTGLFVLAPVVVAADGIAGSANKKTQKEVAKKIAGDEGSSLAQAQNIFELVSSLLNTIFGVLAVISVVLIVYAGFLWVTAAGSDEQVNKAKKIIKGTIIGLIVVGLSYGIVTFTLTIAGGRRLIS